MKKQLFTTLFLSILVLTCLGQQTEWAKGIGSSSLSEQGDQIMVDVSGNSYTSGTFKGTIDFDPGPNVFELTSAGSGYSAFILKLDNLGKFLWAIKIDGSVSINDLIMDESGSTQFYASGHFYGKVDFNPGSGTNELTALGTNDIFISKLDSSGKFLWVKGMGGTKTETINAMVIDKLGFLYCTGSFSGTVDFDPGIGVDSRAAISNISDVFISKLDSLGNHVWVKQISSQTSVVGKAIAFDGSMTIVISGTFRGKTDFNPGLDTFNLTTPPNGYNAFLAKLDTSGGFIWTKQFSGIESYGHFVGVDGLGNFYCTGIAIGGTDLDPGVDSKIIPSTAGLSVFFIKLNTSGNFIWGSYFDVHYLLTPGLTQSSAVDASGNLFLSGHVSFKADFNPGTGAGDTLFLNSGDNFVVKINPSGSLGWVLSSKGPISKAMALGKQDQLYITGFFTGTVDFDYSAANLDLISQGASDIFIHKISQISASYISTSFQSNKVRVYPNPSMGKWTVDFEGKDNSFNLVVRDITGKVLGETHYTQTKSVEVEIESGAGVFFLELKTDEGATVFLKVIKQ